VAVSVLRTVIYVLLGAALATIIYANYGQEVVVYFDFTRRWRTEPVPLSLALLGALLIGFLGAAAVGIVDQLRLRSKLRKMRRHTEKLEAELGALRNLPLGESQAAPSAGRESGFTRPSP
jgi:uncharacterized integral membrane protein